MFFFSQLLLFFEILLLLNFDTKTFLTCVVNGEQPLKIYRYIKTFFEYLKISFLKCHIIMVNRIIWWILLIRIHHSLLVKYFWESNVLKFELHKKSHFFSTILSRPPSDFPHYFSLFYACWLVLNFVHQCFFHAFVDILHPNKFHFDFSLIKRKCLSHLIFISFWLWFLLSLQCVVLIDTHSVEGYKSLWWFHRSVNVRTTSKQPLVPSLARELMDKNLEVTFMTLSVHKIEIGER